MADTYTGTLADIGVNVLADWKPRLSVRPETEAFGPNSLVTTKRVIIPVVGPNNAFTVDLTPSSDLVGVDGRAGVKYVFEVALFEESMDGTDTPVLHNQWTFTAIAGGGPVAEMGNVPPIALYIGPPWPSQQLPGAYFDTTTGDLGYYAIGVN